MSGEEGGWQGFTRNEAGAGRSRPCEAGAPRRGAVGSTSQSRPFLAQPDCLQDESLDSTDRGAHVIGSHISRR